MQMTFQSPFYLKHDTEQSLKILLDFYQTCSQIGKYRQVQPKQSHSQPWTIQINKSIYL